MAQFTGSNPPTKIKLSIEGNNEAMWKTFKEDFKFFMLSAGFKSRGDDEKIALLINLGGDELKRIYNSLVWAAPTTDVPDESQEYDTVIQKLNTYFNVKKNQFSARKTFSILQQSKDENIDQFITKIRTKVKECDFKTEEIDTQMRDRLVFGCKEESLREKFFKEEYEKLTFEKAVAICSVYQSARRQMAACRETEETVHAVAGKKNYRFTGRTSSDRSDRKPPNTYRPTNVKIWEDLHKVSRKKSLCC